MKVHVINSTSGMIRVHAAGCRDIEKDVRRSNSNWIEECPDGVDVAEFVVNELNESFGWTPNEDEPQPFHACDVEVLPCAQKAVL